MMKSKYETHVLPYLDKIASWIEQGATGKEVAAKLGIADSTFRKYLDLGEKGDERYAALSAAFTHAREVPNDEVQAALYKSCLGYNAQIRKTFKVKEVIFDEDTGKKISEKERLETAIDEVHVPANVTAQMFWLANQMPDKWKYKPEEKQGEEDQKKTGVVLLPEILPQEEGGEE